MPLLLHSDNLPVLQTRLDTASVDLVYLDPPFNTARDYEVLPSHPGANRRAGEIAFQDRWNWDTAVAASYETLSRDSEPPLAVLLSSLRAMHGESSLLAYLVFMAPRLLGIRRVLRAGGSMYLHCAPNVSHYLRVLCDAVFGTAAFRREIIWRSGWVSGFKSRARNWIRNHDVILYYTVPGAEPVFNKEHAYRPHPPGYKRRGGGSNSSGIAIDDVWDDAALYSPWIKSFSSEKLGWSTQKPLALLERIISVSSNPGDVVLDPFCGSGTTLHAAQLLGRDWIGIDVSAEAVELAQRRLEQIATN